MQARSAAIFWTPATYPAWQFGRPPGPRVAVLPYDQRASAETRNHRMWVSAWEGEFGGSEDHPSGEAERLAALAMVLIHFHTLTARDGIPLDMAHQAFLAIDEYRQH